MILIKIIECVVGYVNYEIATDDITRFVNLCSKNRISVWNIKKGANSFFATSYAKDYKSVDTIAKENNINTTVKKLGGIPAIIKKHKKRLGLAIGIIIAVAFLLGTQEFIWTIDVSGNKNITREDVIKALSDEGIGFGTYKGNISYDVLKSKLMKRFNNISWVAVNIMGTKIHIELNEVNKKPEIEDLTKQPTNIVATKDGIITKVTVKMGQKEVNIGDAVVEGDLLINGIMEDDKGNSLFRQASGEILAKTEFSKEFTIDLAVRNRIKLEDSDNEYQLKIGQSYIPLFYKNNLNDLSTIKKFRKVSFFGIIFPLEIMSVNNYKFLEEDIVISENTAINIAKKLQDIYEKNELSDAKILSRDSKVNKEYNKLVYKVDYICEENIGNAKEFQIFTKK